MRLLSPLAYFDPTGVEWNAPSGWVVDGASIPQVAWSFIGGPFEGKYRNASVIHDVGCDQKNRPWEAVHEVFYSAMLTSGVETWRAKIMYAAVYHFGPRRPRQVTIPNLSVSQTSVAKERALSGTETGTTAEIVRVRPRGKPRNTRMMTQPVKADLDVRLEPPSTRLDQADFEKLKQAIEDREPTAAGGFSLQEIRNYQPQR